MIKIYRYDIGQMSDEEYACLMLTLPKDEISRISAISLKDRRKGALAGHLLALEAAKELCGETAPVILRTKEGKPYFENLPIKFNLSHSEERVVLAVSDREIGVDIEKIRPARLDMAKRFFTEREQAYVDGDLTRFYEIWTKKEAYGKCHGGMAKCLSVDITALDFYTEDDGEFLLAIYEE